MHISILFPSDYGRPYILRAITAIGKAIPGCVLTIETGDTDAPCVDTVPMGAESVISRILMAGG